MTPACWNELAERTQALLCKGAQILVQGRLSVRTFKDKNNLEKTAVDIIASTVQLLDKRQNKTGAEANPAE